MRTITHASLFSGIGGAEIAAAWLGWENLFHCDINEFGRKVLGYWFPKSKEYNDIKTTDFTEWRGRVDVLTAGFPCQPFSLVGKRRGADDDRYLWPETLRAINEIRPAWFVGENVFGIASMVLPGEEVDMGRTDDLFDEGNLYRTERRFVLDRICRDIEDAGYTVQPVVIPAGAVGAPHRRDRVWFVARREDVGHDAEDPDRHGRGDRLALRRAEERGQRVSGAGDSGRLRGDLADPDSDGFHRGDGKDEVIADERRVDALVTLARAVHTLLPTQVASDAKGGVSCVQGARAERPGLLTLADMGSLCLLPTPLAVSVRHSKRVSAAKAQGSVSFRSRLNGEEAPTGLEDWLEFHGLMPSPVAQDYRRRGPNSRQQGLPEVFHRLLHTPIADGLKKRTGKGQERMRAEDFEAMFPENGGSPGSKDGRASQLNPLFVGEMMGYPLEWLTLPFLSGDGEGRP